MNDYDRLIGVKWSQSGESSKILNNSNVLLNSKAGFIFISEIVLLLLVIIGDYYVFDTAYLILKINQIVGFLNERLIRALLDNICHCLVGVLSWCIISYPKLILYEIIAVGFMSSIIDIDHFISARSLNLNDAISLVSRPFLHNSMTLCALNLLVFFLFYFVDPTKLNWALMFFISWFSHHIRDANRRGMWFGTLFTSPAIPDFLYLSIITCTPLFLRVLISTNFILSLKRSYESSLNSKADSHII